MKKQITIGLTLFTCLLLIAQTASNISKPQVSAKDKQTTLDSSKVKSVNLIKKGTIDSTQIKKGRIDSTLLNKGVNDISLIKKDTVEIAKKVKTRETFNYLHFNVGGGVHNLSYDLLNGQGLSTPIGYTFNAAYSYFFSPYFGIQTGVGAEYFNDSPVFNYLSTTPMVDALNRPYDLRTNYVNWKEKQEVIFLDIPLKLQFKQKLGQNLGIIASAGAKVYIPVYSNFKSMSNGQIVTTGYYSQWNTELSDLPQYGFTTMNDTRQGKFSLKTGYSAVADLGFLFKLSDNTEFYLGGYFNYGLNNILAAGTKEIYQFDGVYNGALASSQVKSVTPVAFGVKLGVYLQVGKKDSDKDGVSDKKDQCPNTPFEAFGYIDVKGCPLDTDGDSIPDYLDKCPDTPKEAFGKVDSLGCPLDTDNDSIPDYLDKCPDTPKEAIGKVDSLGCPLDTDGDSIPDYLDKCSDTPKEAFGKIDSLGCPLDTDLDSVPDYLDKCPNTPIEAKGKVDKNGCPLDTDKDGILDYLDKCPTIAGVASNKGCPEIKPEVKALFKKALQGIQFETGKYKIKSSSYSLLNQIAIMLLKNPTYLIEVQGHTDNVGKAETNLSLSEKRAEAVKQFIIKAGVDQKRLTSKGYGDTVPVTSNLTSKGRSTNRRVEFVVSFEEVVK